MESNGRIERVGFTLLRLSLAILFIWFGLLKVFDLCPLSGLIGRTFPFLPPAAFVFTLGCGEVVIGLCILTRSLLRLGLGLLLLHLLGTALPLIVIPQECFILFPFGLTLAGQYIVKNIVLASAAMALAGRYWTVSATCRSSDEGAATRQGWQESALPAWHVESREVSLYEGLHQ